MTKPILLKFDSLEEEVLFLRSGNKELIEENAKLQEENAKLQVEKARQQGEIDMPSEENKRLVLQSLQPVVLPIGPDTEALMQQIGQLKVEIARLVSQLGQKTVRKNSNNSSIAPSHDIAGKNKSLREPTGKPVGGQPGHVGTTLLHFGAPTETEGLVPGFCNTCGGPLGPGEAVSYDRHQVVDIPPPPPPVCKEYRRYGRWCTCCNAVKLPGFPKEAANHMQYGANIQSMVVYHWQRHILPFGRPRQWFWDVLGIKISKGALENIIRKVAGRLRADKAAFRGVRLRGPRRDGRFRGR
jgi:hypothetical protein